MREKAIIRRMQSIIIRNSLVLIQTFIVLLSFSALRVSAASYKERSVIQVENTNISTVIINNPDLKAINSKLRIFLGARDTAGARPYYNALKDILGSRIVSDSTDIADALYLSGIYSYLKEENSSAILLFKKTVGIIERSKQIEPEYYYKCLYNLGISFRRLGDINQFLKYTIASVEVRKSRYGEDSLEMVEAYGDLVAPYIDFRDYEKAIEYANKGLSLADRFPHGMVDWLILAELYTKRGIALAGLYSYEQARTNLEKAVAFYEKFDKTHESYINTLDNLGTVFHFLGIKEKTYFCYEKALKILDNNYTSDNLNLVCNYAIILANDSLKKRGELILSEILRSQYESNGTNSSDYYYILRRFADYLRDYNINNDKAIQLYLEGFRYVKAHPWDKEYHDNLVLGYALSLDQNGNFRQALDSIQSLLFPGKSPEQNKGETINPSRESLKNDVRTIRQLSTKYKILWKESVHSGDIDLLEAAAGTMELVIAILEEMRLKIGEEGSRMLLGDKFKDAYMDAIICFKDCYSKTNDRKFLEKAFEYSEKSKVASLLASTREMKGMRDNIPSSLANMEKDMERSIALYSSLITNEENSEKPDVEKISLWNDYVLIATQKRDSIIKVFERSYPEYHALKYNTSVVTMSEIPSIIGKRANYLSYILTDSVLYTFVTNSKHQQLISQKIDSSFSRVVSEFRKILTNPDLDGKAGEEYYRFQVNGSILYSYLIEPVKQYLTSNSLIISPDNILSYLPFETFLTTNKITYDLKYKDLPYLMNDYNISYTYSATLLSEYKSAEPAIKNSTIIFAPSYNSPITIDSIPAERQSSGRVLQNLPFAKEEAKFVSGKTRGSLYMDTAASESVYKRLAGDFDIIHLAMHTLINNQNPGLSKMFFSDQSDSLENRVLNVFEIYGIPLTAKMVVLSSCNTGSGNLRKGEGILSLARGFIYSGSKSVVMSLWEVDDRSGTDIMKLFYRNLKNGNSKSISLRMARREYLKNAGQLRSHPYYWSTLVVYGDDSPLYFHSLTIIFIILIPVIVLSGIIYYRKKRLYS